MNEYLIITAAVFTASVVEKIILSFYVMKRHSKQRRKAMERLAQFEQDAKAAAMLDYQQGQSE